MAASARRRRAWQSRHRPLALPGPLNAPDRRRGAAICPYGFRPLAGFSFGNGRSIAKDYDGNYAIDAVASSATDGLNLDFEVDALGNIGEPGHPQIAVDHKNEVYR